MKDYATYKRLTISEFTKAAEVYDSGHAGIYEMCKDDYPPILNELIKDDFENLLDVGCGTGPMIELLASEIPGKQYTGLDLTPRMIEVANAKNIEGARFIVGDADALRALIEVHPNAVCVNLGCGFDDKFSQVDNGQIEWFDVDLPDQIAVRRKVYKNRPRCTMLEGDALDDAWTKQLPKGRPVIVVMEGVLEYFTKEQTATCLHMLCDSFEHGWLVSEMNSMFIVKHSKQHDAIKNTNATFKWGTDSGEEFIALEPRLLLVSEQSYNVEMRKHTLRGKLFAATLGKNANNRLAIFAW